MTGLVRIVTGALLLAAFLRFGLAHSVWLAAGTGVLTAGAAVLATGRAEGARWGALALALVLVGAAEIRHGMTRSGKLLLGLVIWIALAEIIHWLLTATDVTPNGEKDRR